MYCRSETGFKLDPVTETEVYKYLSNVKPTKSTGYDKIPPKLIKGAAGVISKSLPIIFNKSIISGIFPEDLKIAVLRQSLRKVIDLDVITIDQFQYFLL